MPGSYARTGLKRGYRRSRRYVRKPQSTGQMMNYVQYVPQLMRSVKMLKGLVNAERKYVDTGDTPTITNTGTITLLNAIAQGDDVNNRDGNSILCPYIRHRGVVKINSSATATAVRMLIVMDTANQGSTPAVTDVLQSANVTAYINVDNTKRFWILFDQLYHLDINGNRQILVDKTIPIKQHLRYSGSSSTNVLQNAIYSIHISDEATNTPTGNMTTRVTWYDN